MTDLSLHARAAPRAGARACPTVGCELPSRDPHELRGLCDACVAVYAAAFALYWELVEPEGVRMENKTPGIIDATRRAMAMTCTAAVRPAPGCPAVPVFRDVLEDAGVPIDWQVERLETFVAELRAVAIPTGGSS
jgi:hypothetical protein